VSNTSVGYLQVIVAYTQNTINKTDVHLEE